MATHEPTPDLSAAEEELARLQEFLRTAPPELHSWATKQVAEAEAELDRVRERVARQSEAREEALEANLLGLDADDLAEPAPKARPATAGRRRPWFLHPLFLLVVAALVVLGIFVWGDKSQQMPADHPSVGASGTPQPQATPSVDVKLLAGLEARVEKDPKDVDAWRGLGQMYGRMGENVKAEGAWTKVVELAPTDVDGHLALGVAAYNQKKIQAAEKHWTKAAELDAKNAAAHYNLGFLYLGNKQTDKARAAWQKVIDIDPKSTMAETVTQHMKGLDAPASSSPSATSSAPASSAPSATSSR